MSRAATNLVRLIHEHGFRLFTSTDIIMLTGLNPDAATHALCRLAAQKLVARIKRGLWINTLAVGLMPAEAVPHLTAPWPGYVSLYTALADADIVAEIPHVTYAVSSGPPKRLVTPIGAFHIHHLPPRLIWGYSLKQVGQALYPGAAPEKAFLDLVYLGLIPRSPLRCPVKRERQWNLDRKRLRAFAKRFAFPPLVDYLKKNRLWTPKGL